jgi:hypothetical protein
MIDTNARKKMKCPYNGETCINGWRKDFKEEPDGERILCRLWTHVHTKDPFSEQIVEMWDCSLAWTTTILAGLDQSILHTNVSVQEVRNTLIDSLPEDRQREVLQRSVTRMMVQATSPALNPGGHNLKKIEEIKEEARKFTKEGVNGDTPKPLSGNDGGTAQDQ